MRRHYTIYMVQRKLSCSDHWVNVKAFIDKESAEEHVKTCESISRNNIMRIEEEILIVSEP